MPGTQGVDQGPGPAPWPLPYFSNPGYPPCSYLTQLKAFPRHASPVPDLDLQPLVSVLTSECHLGPSPGHLSRTQFPSLPDLRSPGSRTSILRAPASQFNSQLAPLYKEESCRWKDKGLQRESQPQLPLPFNSLSPSARHPGVTQGSSLK